MTKQKDDQVEGRSIGRITMKEEDKQEGPSRRMTMQKDDQAEG